MPSGLANSAQPTCMPRSRPRQRNSVLAIGAVRLGACAAIDDRQAVASDADALPMRRQLDDFGRVELQPLTLAAGGALDNAGCHGPAPSRAGFLAAPSGRDRERRAR